VRITNAALEEGVHLVGLSVLSGSHLRLVDEVVRRMREAGIGEVPVVVGGIVPEEDAAKLRASGVARVYTPKDYDVTRIIGELVELIEASRSHAA
jgi:(2R)-ethylmalonyl-CoA mutase